MSWETYCRTRRAFPEIGLSIETSRMDCPDSYFQELREPLENAVREMSALEGGAIANPDEGRMVGHYWLRAPELAPDPAITREIRETLERIHDFADRVHSGNPGGRDGSFTHLLIIGIGGSALGPQFVAQALGHRQRDRMMVHFLDNTDPDGFDHTLGLLAPYLGRTLVCVISKSGGTPETRNGMLETQAAFHRAGIPFAPQAVAITGQDSKLDRIAEEEGWLIRFPMWDWVGGRTSELGPVGLIPASLQGLDIDEMLAGAAAMDQATRLADPESNPAVVLARMWHYATDGRGAKDMVVLPYKDRLQLFSRYLQQLIMESLGKEKDLDGNVVNQGITVYGNKGSTDQHAYVQQLREGVHNFFVIFIEVLKDRDGPEVEVEPGITSGDYLHGFLLGTRDALHEKSRNSLTLTVREISPRVIGSLIALFERTVGLYASLVHINAYHQPGVEAGKKAAADVLEVQQKVLGLLHSEAGRAMSASEISRLLEMETKTEWIYKILCRLAVNRRVRVDPPSDFPCPDDRFAAGS